MRKYNEIPDDEVPETLGSLSRDTFFPKPNVYVTDTLIKACDVPS